MAKILPSAAIGAARGSVGTVVFTQSAYGAGIRQKVIPSQPNTSAQQQTKAGAASLSRAWGQILTPSQRQDWSALALAHPRLDVFSQTVHLTGMQLYLGSNQALKKVGLPRIDDAPLTYSCGTPNTVTLTWNDLTKTLSVGVSTVPAATEVPVIWASRQLSMGTKAKKVGLVVINYQTAGDPGPWDISFDYQAKKGVFIEYRAITVRVQYTDNTSGCQGLAAINQVLLTP
jgi:hypothetical protein